MSKAFTKESDGDDDPERDEDESSPLPANTPNYITPAGAARLREELKRLLDVERPEVVRTVSWAASNGDRSENGDYIYGKRRLREIDRRIRFLTKRLEKTQIIDPAQVKSDQVLFGATVTIRHEDGREQTYQIVGIDEADVSAKKISWISPLAKALLNSRKGDAVNFRSPKGEEEIELLSLTYM